MAANIYVNGIGLVTAIGSNVSEVLAAASNGIPEPASIDIMQSEDTTRMRYFSIKDPAINVGAGRIDAIIDKVINQAITDSGISAVQLAGAGLFVGSTSFDMFRCEMAIKASAKTSADIALHTPSFNALNHYIQKSFAINGPVYTFNTACTSSANALIYAAEFIRRGNISHALVLGLEFFNEVTALGFSSLELISQQGMRPFASNRDGLYLGEGCGAVLISAQPRPLSRHQSQDFVFKAGATIGDNFSLTASNPDGNIIQRVIEQALTRAKVDRQAISLVKTHGTASLSNDEAESAGLSRVFGTAVPPIVALKPFIGHTLGACGINELIVFMQSIKQKQLINSPTEIAADYPLRFANNEDIPVQGGHYLLNYFGFGGNNTALVMADAEADIDDSQQSTHQPSYQPSHQSRQKPLLIYAASNFYHSVGQQPSEQQLPQLKPILQQVCGKKIRRIDRFTQLALIGGFQCRPEQGLPTSTGVYMSSSYGAVNNTGKVLSEIYQQGQLPKPLNFINTVSNTACFYLSEQLGLSASNQFVTSESFALEAGLNIASIDLELGNIEAALVGQVCEVDSNLDVHRQRLQLPTSMGLAEGSHWLLVAHQLAGQQALAEITLLKAPLSAGELDSELLALSAHCGLTTEIGFADAVDPAQRAHIVSATGASEVQYAPVDLRHEYHSALQLQGFLAADNSAGRFVCIDKNTRGYYSLIVIEKRG